jgi:predicted transcriptional regulator
MSSVKTAISLDAPLLQQIDAVAEELRIPRSRLLATAAKEFLLRHQSAKLLDALNRAHANGPSEEEVERRRVWKRQHRRRIEGEFRTTLSTPAASRPRSSVS